MKRTRWVALSCMLLTVGVGLAMAQGKWEIWKIVEGENAGEHLSLDLDTIGRPHIAYFVGGKQRSGTVGSTEDLMYGFYDGTKWTAAAVATEGRVGEFCSLALDASDVPRIAFRDISKRILLLAKKTTRGWSITQIDGSNSGEHATDIAISKTGISHISYYWNDSEGGSLGTFGGLLSFVNHTALKHAILKAGSWETSRILGFCTKLPNKLNTCEPNCQFAEETEASGGHTLKPGSGAHVGQHSSIALDFVGNPHIAFNVRGGLDDLVYARWDGKKWHLKDVDTVDKVGEYASIALDGKGSPHISYYDTSHDDLKYAWMEGGAWNTITVDSKGDVGEYSRIAIDPAGNPHIIYLDASNKMLKHAFWNGSSWEIEVIDSQKKCGEPADIAIDATGRIHVVYRFKGKEGGGIKYARLIKG